MSVWLPRVVISPQILRSSVGLRPLLLPVVVINPSAVSSVVVELLIIRDPPRESVTWRRGIVPRAVVLCVRIVIAVIIISCFISTSVCLSIYSAMCVVGVVNLPLTVINRCGVKRSLFVNVDVFFFRLTAHCWRVLILGIPEEEVIRNNYK